MTLPELNTYAQALVAEVLATAETENLTAPEAFTRRVLDDLEQAGEVENTFLAYHRAHGVEVSGYGSNDSLGTLDLFVTAFSLQPSEDRLPRTQAETLLKRLATFAKRCADGLARDIDESSDVHDMCTAVEKALAEGPRLRLFLLTDMNSSVPALPPAEVDGLAVTYEIWDLQRLHRLTTSGTFSEPIHVDFDPPIPCVSTPPGDRGYTVMLAMVPGQDLSDLYGLCGTRLLELNVRSFLQTKGGVNRGIRDTLLNSPDDFLAYNNGITATASEVDLVQLAKGGRAISRIRDLQIVNGGQTTASLHYARTRDKADLSRVWVQMKLNVVSPDRVHEIVPQISRYSNTQNKVTLADFSSNHPFHIAVEKVTRSIWAPAVDGSGQETRWFYERARGQYTDALALERTPTNQRRFKALNPLSQKFTKADLAKYVHAHGQLPHYVSRGAEKNFREFMLNMGETPPAVDVAYCQRLIAKAILFKAADRVVAARNFGGYKINIVAYTVARLVEASGRRIDLDRIWREQGLSRALTAAIDDLCVPVREVVVHPLRGTHVGEWAKRVECWEAVLDVAWAVPDDLAEELTRAPVEDIVSISDQRDESATIAEVEQIPAEDWLAVARWSKETQNLEPWQRQLAASIGRYISSDTEISDKQATQALQLMVEAEQLGFRRSE
ncbi:AIPR family protein [Dactylosporangium sp. NPDC000521]|uniref:AIPR family protein n=1 Tax=Dactylosporangium sp. NPDC000521 TaxID=3363975 RepID=UPI00369BC21C